MKTIILFFFSIAIAYGLDETRSGIITSFTANFIKKMKDPILE